MSTPVVAPPPTDAAEVAAWLNRQVMGWNRTLGIQFVMASAERVEATLEVDERHHQPFGVVHGGVHAGLIETLCSVGAALAVREPGQPVVGLENSTSLLRAVREGTLRAVAVPVSVGHRTQVWECTVADEQGRPVASGRLRLMCLPPASSLAGETVALRGG